MKKRLSIINIDGVDGIGKTTQINVLTGYFLRLQLPFLLLQLEDNTKSALKCAKATWEFLEKEPDGIVICDGSIAKMMVLELIKGVGSKNIVEKYREILHEHELLNHKYGMANILMIIDDIKVCHERILKRGKLMKIHEEGITDFKLEAEIIKGLRTFGIHTISKSLDFHILETDDSESILDINEEILKYLENNFEIKKPSS